MVIARASKTLRFPRAAAYHEAGHALRAFVLALAPPTRESFTAGQDTPMVHVVATCL
jgi:hypothetical protein